MKALALVDGFGIDRLRWIERPVPEPRPGEVLVRIGAVALNHRDRDIIGGKRKLALPLIPASDACGTVVAIGAGATRFAVGDRVMPCFIQGWIGGEIPAGDVLPTLGGPLDGVLAEYCAWPEPSLVLAPAHLSDVEAATLACAGVSAWNALFETGTLRPGDTVLIQGTGGVSLFALQFARRAGARTIVTSSSDAKLDRAKALGADHAINYRREPAWGRNARALTEAGVDCVVEIGGSRTLGQSIVALRNGGRISLVGFLSGSSPDFDLGELSRKAIRLHGIRVGSRTHFEAMCRAIGASGLRPIIGAVHASDDAIAALTSFTADDHFGKVCIAFPGGSERP